MALLEINRDPPARQVRQFGFLLLPAVCLLLAGLAVRREWGWPSAAALAACGGLSILVAWARPRWMRIVVIAWMWAAFPIGWLMSHLLMGVIYFGVIAPIGLLMRAAGRDPLTRKFERGATTYWTPRDQDVEPSRYFRQF